MRKIVKTEFLVVGSGIAGLTFAIQASKFGKVSLVTKKELMESNTNLAQGGIAAVLSEDDSFESHIDDTLRNGCGLSKKEVVETLVRNGPQAVGWLIDQGVEFDKEQNRLSLSMESGHSTRRIAHKGDYTGKEIEESLVASVRRNNVEAYENCLALDIIVKDNRSYGAEVLNLKEGKILTFLSNVTVLATGGIGQIYAQTSNPYIATGDGIAMAYRAGVKLEDMEFIQFHPTTFPRLNEPNFLISETVRGEGGILRTSSGEAFMERYDEAKELAPRDIVSRAVFEELKKGKVYLDLKHMDGAFIHERFPTIYNECLRFGIDVATELIPIVPAAHYLCGGIKVDLFGESSLKGLFALGECSCTGVHGANRLASNSLLESVVFSIRSLSKAKSYITSEFLNSIPEEPSLALESSNSHQDEIRKKLQSLMWDYVGIVRSIGGLTYATSKLLDLEKEISKITNSTRRSSFVELKNMLTVAKLIVKAASLRRESRGTHYLLEHPNQDDENWLKHVMLFNKHVEIN